MDLRQLRDNPDTWPILEARAQALAQREATADVQLGEERLTFRLGDQRYAIFARLVREVRALSGYTPLPGTPAFVLGLVNLRGRLLMVMDIRPLLGLPPTPARAGAVLLIAGANGIEVGLLADEVIGIQRASAELSPALSAIEGQAVAWVRGIDRDLNVQFDLELLLADSRVIASNAYSPAS